MGMYDADGNIFPEVAATLKTIPQGAATTVWCATSPMLNDIGGVYCENADVAELDLGKLSTNMMSHQQYVVCNAIHWMKPTQNGYGH